ncbi:hypothetical protein [Pleomorphomonas sp. PLEO]|uniref:hypothetical protein n=1 Tax=Pleomorphomonas sp. PLEO TaxID=3239306 RepID=UPI00351EC7DF
MKKKRIYLNNEQMAVREQEIAHQGHVDIVADALVTKRAALAKAQALNILDSRTASWPEVSDRWDKEREEEAESAKLAAKERKRRRKLDMPNLKVSPVLAQTFSGERVMVDSISGRFNLMVKRYGWQRELGEACQRFEHDYQLSLGGIRSQSLEPHVDGGRSPQNTAQVEAIQTIRCIEQGMHPEEWVVLVLWAGHGITIKEMHKQGWGVTDELGRRLKRAASHAAAYYQGGHRADLVGDTYHRMVNAISALVNGSTGAALSRGALVADTGTVTED